MGVRGGGVGSRSPLPDTCHGWLQRVDVDVPCPLPHVADLGVKRLAQVDGGVPNGETATGVSQTDRCDAGE